MSMNLIAELTAIVGDKGILTGEDVSQRQDGWIGAPACSAQAIVRPADTAELSAVMKLCYEQDQTIVVHGGLTGLVNGARTTSNDIVISLERMRNIVEIDAQNRTMTVQSGVNLQTVQEKAEDEGLYYPVDLGARGTATIGGTIATNAGGNRVLRYGMTRDSILGLEAVLADGTIISSMSKVLKNNTGYNLPHLFIGAEGTLGIVTQAVLRLRAKPLGGATALVAVEDFESLSKLLNLAESGLGGGLSSFEVMWHSFYDLVTGTERHRAPIPAQSAYYVIIETQGNSNEQEQERLEMLLGDALEQELISDAVLTQSDSEREKIWAIRDDVEALFELAPIHGFDVSLPISAMESYVEKLQAGLDARWPDNRLIVFGHLGDGNLHVIVTQVPASDKKGVEELVYGGLNGLGGSISAEHGIGLDKKPYLQNSRSPAEIALMKQIKQTMDPKGLLNPGKVLS
ncbi:oxidoreductase [Marinobacterium nitratireducens]|uniref:Oxidoreductase n=1 Tax=Marinobacterium nitratireducens TaxID=518897 RepID=A0A917ZCB8_9GAMM|nr:FAD-binding oxidoreductase [Marinobacterium nitratireducens]GGO78961.1 oxidoreductase [Marinobacterium nitratireducens]